MTESKGNPHLGFTPLLLASTGSAFNSNIHQSGGDGAPGRPDEAQSLDALCGVGSNYFKSAQWSPDGTTILTSSADQTLRTYILPPDLLSPELHNLQPYTSHVLPSPSHATSIHPAFALSSPSTVLYLTSLGSLPTRLISPFAAGIRASYPLINATTEAYIAPHSLLFDTHRSQGQTFFTGSESEISVFDVSRDGQDPVSRIKTIPSRRKKAVGGGVGMKGIVSALGMSSEGILAGGTFTRWVGLYDGGGRGGFIGAFEIKKQATDLAAGDGIGITQVLWSACGRYLCVVERGSDGVGVWDIRNSGRRVQWLQGRKAQTMQRLGVEVVDGKIWAGGTDGVVRRWEGLGMSEGMIEPVQEFKAHDDAVSSAVMHPCGNILATCSGQRHFPEVENAEIIDSGSEDGDGQGTGDLEVTSLTRDNSLKVWTF